MKETSCSDLSLKNILFTFNNASKSGNQYLNNFSRNLLSPKSIILEEKDILYLKKILIIASKHPEMLLHAAYFIKKLDLKIHNFSLYGNIISIPLNEILIQLSFTSPLNLSQNGCGETEYLKSLILSCTKFPNIKEAIMNTTFLLFCQFVTNINSKDQKEFFCIDFIQNILSSLFQLEINLIWHSITNQNLVNQNLKPDHFLQFINLIQIVPNSLVQMLIAEWMWRAKNCAPPSFDFKTPLRNFYTSFSQINEANFRSSLHSFIRSINATSNNENNEKQKIIHFKFKKIIFNGINLDSNGYIDLNKETVAIWFTEKGEIKVPDVIVFKFPQIYNIAINEKKISFLSKEKLIALEVFSTSKPMRFEFHCTEIIEKKQAILFSQRCLFKKISQRKQIIVKPSSKKINDQNSSLLKKRIYAKEPQNFADRDDDEMQNNENDLKVENTINEESKSDTNTIKAIENGEKTYKFKIMTFGDIEKSLDDLQALYTKMINDVEKKVMSELNEIISFTESNIKELHNLSQTHQNVVEDTELTELMLDEETSNFERETEKSFNKIENETKNLFDNFVEDICHQKSEFIDETDRIFTSNALTALSNNLLNMKSHSIEKFNKLKE